MRKRLGDLKRWTTTDRDAVIWSVDTSNFYCLVKVQGSATTIKAHYPRNWRVTPTWLKPGNAVRIRHRSGVQGYIELVGHGRAIPTPVEGDALPIPGSQADGIITGMNILEYDGGGMNIIVEDGTYRIDGVVYVFTAGVTGYVVMDDPAPMIMGSGLVMGWGGGVTPVVIDAAPAAGYGRYDALVIASDGTVDVIKGTASSLATEPPLPSVPSNHILIGYLFIHSGMTSIPANAIGVMWTAPRAVEVVATSTWKTANGTFEMPWSAVDDTPEGTITLTTKDQYGNNKSVSATMTITLLIGTGGVAASCGGGGFGSSASKAIGYSASFCYQRNQLATPEFSPVFQIDISGYPSLTTIIPLILLDVSGDPI
jgi:hypothetical protein